MDLKTKNLKYLVTGASSGLGNAVAKTLLNNGAQVILTARREDPLKALKKEYPNQVTIITGDVTDQTFLTKLKQSHPDDLYGAFINAGGPPTGTITETELDDWDNAYQLVLRWKIDISRHLLKVFQKNKQGRFLFSESASVNGPIPNLVLSNSYRMAVVGYVKTMVKEISGLDITANVIAPGFHETPALERIFKKMAEQKNISIEEAQKQLNEKIPVGHLGQPDEFASLATWLLSPLSGFASGQIFTLDGGAG